MKAFHRYAAHFALTLAALLASCSKPILEASRSVETEAQAQGTIDARLNRSQFVRDQVKAIREALRPLETILHDFGKAIDLKIQGGPGDPLAALLDQLEQAFRGATAGMAEIRPDGSWVLERPGPLSAAGAGCSDRIRLSGQKVADNQVFVLALSNCASPQAFVTLATVTVHVDGSRQVDISATAFQGVYGDQVAVNPCVLQLDTAGHANLSCSPIGLTAESAYILVDRLAFRSDEQGVTASIHASLSDFQHGVLGTAEARVQPGRPVDLRVCARGQSCDG